MLKRETGFTLIEMLIVLAVISMLLILVVPNLTEQNKTLHDRSEDVLIQMAENQTQAYFIEKGKYPESIEQLVDEGYLTTAKLSNNTKKLVYVDTDTYKVVTEDIEDLESDEG